MYRAFPATLICVSLAAMPLYGGVAIARSHRPRLPDVGRGISSPRPRGEDQKLSLDLQILSEQIAQPRAGAKHLRFTAPELRDLFGIREGDPDPDVNVAIQYTPGTGSGFLKGLGAIVRSDDGDMIYARVPVRVLSTLAAHDEVQRVTVFRGARLPVLQVDQPRQFRGTPRGSDAPLANEFDHQGLTGKGVIIGVIDSGIDWKHGDFLRPDGSSRILFLYDLTDPSWTTSGGKLGTEPPLATKDGPLGTLYTQEQINAALKGRGEIASHDEVGHGTACAGTAAGNGRATANGVEPGTYAGVAPEADLIVVKAGEGGGISQEYVDGAEWIVKKAQALKKPCVLNMSFGGHWSPHDGTDPEEARLDRLAGPDKPGVALCVAAGNEGADSLHAGGRFGPRRTGQQDIESSGVEVFVREPGAMLLGYFDHVDEWGVTLRGAAFADAKDQPIDCQIFHAAGKYQHSFEEGAQPSDDLRKAFSSLYAVEELHGSEDQLGVTLPPGKYMVWAYGVTEKVPNGRFDLYLPDTEAANFGRGEAERQYMVGSPGNASHAITVAAYTFRSQWPNQAGTTTYYNLPPGHLASFSSPGYRRDGHVKPDIAAPAQYTISSLAAGSKMGQDRDKKPLQTHITPDGYHLAWTGTSAATPYVTGVVALMLQKNPHLDAAEILQVLRDTAAHDDQTGGVPNREWGYGKIRPGEALARIPRR